MPRTKQEIPAAVVHFDQLPDSALVDMRTVAMLEGTDRSTIYRRINRGHFPAPEPQPPGAKQHPRWRVGKIRAARNSYVHTAG